MKGKKKLIFLVLGMLIFLMLLFLRMYEAYQYDQLASQTIDRIECIFLEEAYPDKEITKDMVSVIAFTDSGLSYEARDFTIDQKRIPEHGDSFDLKILYQDVEEIISVPITRKPVVEYSIGYPVLEDVKATVYQNGDLHFTGTGNTRNFRKGNMPWADETYSYVFFESTVEATNMDYWFQGNQKLLECIGIPKTVESMAYTFADCKNLIKTPDYFPCMDLRTMTGCFKNCISLKEAEPLPINIINASEAFYGCVNLLYGAEMDKTSCLGDISKMYYGCTNLISLPEIPSTVKNMEGTFAECVNIRVAALFPEYVENISGCYQNCSSLETGATVPKAVRFANSCYAGCLDLHGTLEIHTDTEQIYRIFERAVTKERELVLNGDSGRLIKIQQDAGNEDIILGDPDNALYQKTRLELEEELKR